MSKYARRREDALGNLLALVSEAIQCADKGITTRIVFTPLPEGDIEIKFEEKTRLIIKEANK